MKKSVTEAEVINLVHAKELAIKAYNTDIIIRTSEEERALDRSLPVYMFGDVTLVTPWCPPYVRHYDFHSYAAEEATRLKQIEYLARFNFEELAINSKSLCIFAFETTGAMSKESHNLIAWLAIKISKGKAHGGQSDSEYWKRLIKGKIARIIGNYVADCYLSVLDNMLPEQVPECTERTDIYESLQNDVRSKEKTISDKVRRDHERRGVPLNEYTTEWEQRSLGIVPKVWEQTAFLAALGNPRTWYYYYDGSYTKPTKFIRGRAGWA